METLKKDLDTLARRQKISHKKAIDSLDALIEFCEREARAAESKPDDTAETVVANGTKYADGALSTSFKDLVSTKSTALTDDHQLYHIAISKCVKSCERSLLPEGPSPLLSSPTNAPKKATHISLSASDNPSMALQAASTGLISGVSNAGASATGDKSRIPLDALIAEDQPHISDAQVLGILSSIADHYIRTGEPQLSAAITTQSKCTTPLFSRINTCITAPHDGSGSRSSSRGRKKSSSTGSSPELGFSLFPSAQRQNSTVNNTTTPQNPQISTCIPLADVFVEVHEQAVPILRGDVQAALHWCALHRSHLAPPHRQTLRQVEFQLHATHYTQLLQGRLWMPVQFREEGEGVGEKGTAAASTPVVASSNCYAAAPLCGTSTSPAVGSIDAAVTPHTPAAMVARPREPLHIRDAAMALRLAQAYARDHLAKFSRFDDLRLENGESIIERLAQLTSLAMYGVRVLYGVGQTATCAELVDAMTHSPYASLLDAGFIIDVHRLFLKMRCAGLDIYPASPLELVVKAGMLALPALYQDHATITNPMPTRDDDGFPVAALYAAYGHGDELPTEVSLGSDLQFHSTFVCPVSKQQCNLVENPPMLLACGHVISRDSLMRLQATRPRFKCPTCPTQQTASQAIPLICG